MSASQLPHELVGRVDRRIDLAAETVLGGDKHRYDLGKRHAPDDVCTVIGESSRSDDAVSGGSSFDGSIAAM